MRLKFFLMKLLDRYVFAEWLKVFAIAMLVTLGILILHDMYNNLGDLINWGASASGILRFYMLVLPTLVPVVLPISLLLSLIYVLGSFHRNSELTAMRAAGMNIFRITRSLWFGAFVLALLLLWLNASIVPDCIEGSRKIYEDARNARLTSSGEVSAAPEIYQLSFFNRSDGRMWYMNSFSPDKNMAKGLSVSILGKDGIEVSRISAERGIYDNSAKHWTFVNGKIIDFNPETHRVVRPLKFAEKSFDEFGEHPKIMLLSMRRAKDLSLRETETLLDTIGDPHARESLPYLVRWYSIWASPFACIIVVAIAIPFSVAGVRTNPMVGVSKTVGLFFLYFVVDSILTAMGGRGIISPEAAAAVPNVAMLIFALSLYRKVI